MAQAAITPSITPRVNPLLLTLFPATTHTTTLSLWPSIGVLALFAAIVFMAGFIVANRRRTLPAA
jgi:ABC-type multidrug transport system permease subunit